MKKKSAITSEHFTIDGNVIHLRDNLTIDNTPAFLRDLEPVLRKSRETDLSLDLSELRYIDSAGATAIHAIKKTAGQYNVSLSVTNAGDDIQNQL
ncbi:MAG: STAS domain-containing protein, partial [Marinilabilia sp.]